MIDKQTGLPPAIVFGADQKVIGASPYPCPWFEFKQRFAFNPQRLALAEKFEAWVGNLVTIVAPEFIWIGGSYASDKPDPKDIDAVLFYRYRQPFADPQSHAAFLNAHRALLTPAAVKRDYGLDCACVALSMPVERLIAISAEWTMILSGNPDGSRRAFYCIPIASMLDGAAV
ncbi:MAG: hypothetical protein O9270_05825 [Aquidulcibacter sp.]|jgi:hypothetical protein|uniref:DUF6932 family protein n=1 Tax=Aquidulcibacter sp. TaxID=2052990 RepID=UPI0022C1E7E8|nr:hypothetical protein [Aquidulcibacter sp.]MCZ8207697.1 hypothetical protein [Aquidulcibacter sp.]